MEFISYLRDLDVRLVADGERLRVNAPKGTLTAELRSQIDEPEIPSGIAIFGTDDKTAECSMLYFDERGVSRTYEVSLRDNVWRWWRNAPGFSQRFTGTFAPDGRSIDGKGELSRDGATWEKDLELTYTRVE